MASALSLACQKWLGSLVIASIDGVFAQKHEPCPPIEPSFSADEAALMSRNLGSFVTLSLNGQLRGCIGSILGREPLYQNIWHMAKQAAFSDPRFPPLTVSEWPQCAIEISVLDEPSLCPDPSLIEIGKHGLILQYRGRTGVFLPQVPVEQGWNLDQYLNHLCYKAQVPPGSHTKEGAQIFWFEAFVFPVAR